jgi:rfaE bifunctional protein nucleotidyltransferase chain/domain
LKKLIDLRRLKVIVNREKRRGKRVVLANGCFDLFHAGHIRYLRGARAKGDILVVALNSDSSVRALKGRGRPLLSAMERAEILGAFPFVDHITIFRELDVEKILLALKPDVHAKGSDYTLGSVPERDVVKKYGGTIFIAGGPKIRSTSEIIRKIASLNKKRDRDDEKDEGKP